jgi:sodium transport system permease protein
MMLPMLLMIFMFSGCLAIAPESIAGEKRKRNHSDTFSKR